MKKKQMILVKNFIIALIVTNILFCNPAFEEYQYSMPNSLDDGWEIGDLSTVGINKKKIEELVTNRLNGNYNKIFSISIAKNSMLVFDKYFPGIDSEGKQINPSENYLQTLQSSTKSITSIALGVAKFIGFDIKLEERYKDIFNDYNVNWTKKKSDIKLIHALSMSAGFDWDEWSTAYGSSENSLSKMDDFAYDGVIKDPLLYLFGLECIYEPGSIFTYNSGLSISLGEVLRRKTDMYIDQFCKKKIFIPMNIKKFKWIKYPNGMLHCGGGLHLRARDFLKFGQLYLNRGIWNGVRLLSEDWVRLSTKIHMETGSSNNNFYGLQWWIDTYKYGSNIFDSYETRGNGGQLLIIIPDLNLVVAFTGGYYGEDYMSIIRLIMSDFIIPSCFEK